MGRSVITHHGIDDVEDPVFLARVDGIIRNATYYLNNGI